MTWWQLSLQCQAPELEQIENLMLELGALSISLSDAADEPIYEPLPGTTPVWQESIVTATFAAEVDRETLYQRLIKTLPAHLQAGVRQHDLHDQDWDQAYKQHFKPLQCAPDLWIVPSWSEPPDPAATVIRLDPGLAFGTGSHPTTFLCLSWLAGVDLKDYRVIDFGCGSGILAIAACKLGARQVIAVDIDPQALSATASNMQVNNISADQIQLSSPADMDQSQANLLVANILAGPLVDLAPRFAALVKSGGQVLLSGILKTQLDEIQLAYQPYFRLEPANYREEWVSISGNRI